MLDFSKEERRDNYILYAYESIEKARIDLIKEIERLKRHKKLSMDFELPSEDWKINIEDNIIKIYIPDYPVRTSDVYKLYNEIWIKNTCKAINSLQESKPVYEKVMVVIKLFLPVKDCDVDNREIKPIIDGIRYSGIIKNDTIEYVSYTVEGQFVKDNLHTEITIIDYERYRKMVNKILT